MPSSIPRPVRPIGRAGSADVHQTSDPIHIWFCLVLVVAIYVLVSVILAVSTADVCDGTLGGQKTWQIVPPHWECPGR